MGVLLQGGDERPRHGTGSLASDLSILGCLIVFATTPHDDVCRACLGPDIFLVYFVATGCFLEQRHGRVCHAAEIATRIARNDAQKALSGFLGEVGFLEYTLGRVNVGQIQSRTRVARVKNGSQSNTGLQRHDHDPVHLVVNNVPDLSEVYRVDDLIVAVLFIAIQIGRLTTMARVVEKEGVVGASVLDEPVHRSEYVGFCRLAHWVLLVVGEQYHIFPLITEVFAEIIRHVLDVVNTPPQLSFLAEIVDADQECLPPTGTVRVLESVTSRRAMAE